MVDFTVKRECSSRLCEGMKKCKKEKRSKKNRQRGGGKKTAFAGMRMFRK